jgi:LysR family hydrogen peroxide-inducible transcriptional activator
MTLQELKYVVSIADSGTFARAARLCHVSQPTLSMQIKKLEGYLGTTLFERNGRTVTLTASGEEIVARARVILEQVAQIREAVRRASGPMTGTLRLGLLPTLPNLMAHILPSLRHRYPELRLLVREEPTRNLLPQLSAGDLDAAIVATPIDRQDFETRRLFSEDFVAVVPADHRLAARPEIDVSELKSETLLLLDDGHCMRQKVLEITGVASLPCREEARATSIATLRHMVAMSVGCTLLPALSAQSDRHDPMDELLAVRPLARPAPSREIEMVWRRGCGRRETAEKLADLVVAVMNHTATPSTPKTRITDAPGTARRLAAV